jgi:hypothetical protein
MDMFLLKYMNKRKAACCVLSSSIILTAATGLAPTPIPLMPACVAAPAPFLPQWLLAILNDLKSGELTSADLDALKKYSKGNYTQLLALINRINTLAAQRGLPYRLKLELETQVGESVFELVTKPTPGNTYIFVITIIKRNTGDEGNSYQLGMGTYGS